MSPPARFRFLITLMALAAAACGREVPRSEEIRPVRVMVLAPSAIDGEAELSGEIRPRVESRVGFQVGGRITSRRVELGQSVQKGEVLATLDAADFRLSAAAAAAQLNAAKVDRDQLRADLRRFEDLHRQGFISGAELERHRAQYDAAEARLAQAEALADVSTNQATHAVLRAPAAGLVSGIDAEVGQVVASGQSVVRMALAGDREVAIAIPETRLEQLRRIPEVSVGIWAYDAELKGRIREIAPIADPATRTFAARVTLLDPPPDLALGMSATVRFVTAGTPRAMAVPLTALLREGEGTYVWKLDRTAMTVRRVPVAVAGISGNSVVIGDGVAAGDTIVIAGVNWLKPGQKVKVVDSGLSEAAAVQSTAGN
jgi:multidrug efflux system membrane fusion protein